MANVSFGGLITGLDTKALIAGLVKAESGSIDILQRQKVRYQAQDGVVTSLISALADLKSKAQALSLSKDFNKRSATSTDSGVVTVSASSTAEVGSHSIVVDKLAKNQIIKSASFTSESASIGMGTLTLTINGKTTDIVVDATNDTLSGLKSAINSAGADVSASIVNVGTNASPDYRLLVQSKNTGTANAVAISGTLSGGGDPFAASGEVVQSAADAVFSVNGLVVTRASNKVSDVITGVTFTLQKEGDGDGTVESSDASAQISIASDSAAIKDSVQGFVDSYNAVAKIINDQFTIDPDTKRQGSMGGDAGLRGVMSRLRKEMTATIDTVDDLKRLSDIGINFQKDGTLALDEAKFTAALADDPDGVSDLFSLVNNGLGKRVPEAVDDFIGFLDGTLTFRQKGIRSSIDSIDRKIEREQARIEAYQEQLVQQFTALEQMVSQMKSQGDFLAQRLSALQK
jgi:flagellar hook-associated protein 2